MKKRGYLLLLVLSVIGVLCLVFLVGCTQTSDKSINTDSAEKKKVVAVDEKALVEKFKNETKKSENVKSENVLKVFCDDFDTNGTYEAFILTGELTADENECRWSEGKVWFVSEKEIEMLQEGLFTHFSFEPKVMTINETKMLHVYKEYATGACSYLFGVVEDKPCTYFAYQNGYIHEKNGKVFLNNSAYDAYYENDMKIFTGHTFKDYYLYFEKDDDKFKGFREYGAIEISLEQFLKFQGAQETINRIKAEKKNVEITNILYRENNIININCIIPEKTGYSQSYVTVNYNDKEVYNFESDGGKYEVAIVPEIATYPVFAEPKK